MMLTKNKNPKVSYYSRLLVLPLAAIVFFAFTIKVKNEKPLNVYDGKTITVVIDAGHGGADNGASAANFNEKNITLAIAKEVKELNDNKNLNIILTRDKDEFLSVHDRARLAAEKKADLFISIHLNAENNQNGNSGMDIFIPGNENKYLKQSQLLGSSIIESFENNYPLKVENELKQRNRGLWLLNDNSCPAVLIQAGFLSTEKDRDYLTKSGNQETIARNILNGIENYAMQEEQSNVIVSNITDTIPPMYYQNKKVTGLQVISKSNKIKVTAPVIKVTYADGTTEMISKLEADKRGFVLPPIYNGKKVRSVEGISDQKVIVHFQDGTKETITREEAKKAGLILFTPPKIVKNNKSVDNINWPNTTSPAIIYLNGKEIPNTEMKNISQNNIESISVLKNESAIKKYGEKGKNGVIEITTKNKNVTKVNTDANTVNFNSLSIIHDTTAPRLQLIDKVFTKTEIAASFPGGQEAWIKYITQQIRASLDSFTKADYGTCVVRFIVDVDGRVHDVQATTMKGTLLAKISTDAIKNGPKWIPAKQNGHEVAAYRLQPVTLKNPSNEKKSSAKSEQSSESSLPATSKNNKEVFLNLIELAQPSEYTSPATAKDNNKVFVKLVEPKVFLKLVEPASFPGGQTSWLKYISRIFDKNGNELMTDKNNEGTCKIRFLVNKEGKVSDVQPVTMKGTQLADVAVNAIQHGPRWNPAKQNGHPVNSYVIAPVTFKLSDKLMNKNEPE